MYTKIEIVITHETLYITHEGKNILHISIYDMNWDNQRVDDFIKNLTNNILDGFVLKEGKD